MRHPSRGEKKKRSSSRFPSKVKRKKGRKEKKIIHVSPTSSNNNNNNNVCSPYSVCVHTQTHTDCVRAKPRQDKKEYISREYPVPPPPSPAAVTLAYQIPTLSELRLNEKSKEIIAAVLTWRRWSVDVVAGAKFGLLHFFSQRSLLQRPQKPSIYFFYYDASLKTISSFLSPDTREQMPRLAKQVENNNRKKWTTNAHKLREKRTERTALAPAVNRREQFVTSDGPKHALIHHTSTTQCT